MNRAMLFVLLTQWMATFQTTREAAAQFPQPTPNDSLKPAEVLDDSRVTFRIYAPKADEVQLASSGDIPGVGFGQSKDLTKNTEGVWEVTVGPLSPGAYRYCFTVDDVTTLDPKNRGTSESNQTTWSLIYVPGADWMDVTEVPHGAVAEVSYWSSTLKQTRRMHVYTPPGYEASDEKYPVFYLLHGAFDSDDSWSTVGRAGIIFDNLIAAGKAKPMVVVMPNGHTGPFSFGRGRGAGSLFGQFEEEFTTDIMPLVEKRYRVHTDRANRAIAGLSMGGGHTLNIGIPHLSKFAYLGVFSSGVFGIRGGPGGAAPQGPSFEERHAAILDDENLKKDLKLVWFATGTDDFLVETSRATVEMLKKHGFDVAYKETDGGHTWDNWREYLNEFTPLLFQ
jgi:enterochelin esterase family protein